MADQQTTIIASTHQRIRSLMAAIDGAGVDGVPPELVPAICRAIEHLTDKALRTGPENAVDALLQIDLALPRLEGAHDDAVGMQRVAIESAMVALCGAASAIGFLTGRPLQIDGSLSDLPGFAARASVQYLQADAV